MKRFEYKFIHVPTTGSAWTGVKIDFEAFNKQLNEAGKMGWEVINHVHPNVHAGLIKSSFVILKKEIN
jgi:Domain of unknown function (DUF4177)